MRFLKALKGNARSPNFISVFLCQLGSSPFLAGKEIVQPYVFDKASFTAWKDEAFDLWTSEWGNLYDLGSPSQALLQEIQSTYYLVALLDNDYVPRDVFGVLGA